MKYLIFILLVACSTMPLTKFQNDGKYFVAGCSIYDLNGKVVRSYPGQFCVFMNDGSFVTYEGAKLELTKYDGKMNKLWVLKTHIHHGLEITEQGDLITQSSYVKPFMGTKRVRFDVMLRVNQQGEIVASFEWKNHLQSLLPSWGPFEPYEIRENKELELKHEITHQASCFELYDDMKVGDLVIPKGSIIATLNGLGSGIYIFDKDLTKILYSTKVPLTYLFHDAQQFSKDEIIYFKNSVGMRSHSSLDRALIMIYDLTENRTTTEVGYDLNLSGTVQGGTQKIDGDTILISDYVNDPKVIYPESVIENPSKLELRDFHRTRKVRATLYSLSQKKVLHQITFPFIEAKVRLLDVRGFLKNNVGL